MLKKYTIFPFIVPSKSCTFGSLPTGKKKTNGTLARFTNAPNY
jgi:hypothetical protein